MEDSISEILVKSECYVNSNKTNDTMIKTANGDKVIAYLSCRLAISNVEVRKKIEDGLIEQIQKRFTNDVTIVGMATAGIPWAHAVAEKLELPLLYLRSSEKEYGLKGLIEGNMKFATKKAIIIDDVLYTGNTVKKAQKVLTENGIKTVGVACIASLRDSTCEELIKQQIKVVKLTDYRKLITSALNNKVLNENEYNFMKKIYEEK